ncbi:hypothetical protein [Vreelandella massiliensis]|uniref:hypothetical protein n=1 Tax=Vreelandella massiliensis TaxID=1816686 RepID=UPI00096A7FC1|nr:hypothetical protein [Halomonas massiliensis]
MREPHKFMNILDNALMKYKSGFDPELIELPEQAVFPHLISAAPATARKSRSTGMLLGLPAPTYVKRGRTVRYRLSAVLQWIEKADNYSNTAEAHVRHGVAD